MSSMEFVRDENGKITGLRDLYSGVTIPLNRVGGNHNEA